MKIHSFIFDFLIYLIIFVFFALSPIFSLFFESINEPSFSTWNFSPFLFIELAVCIFLVCFYYDKKNISISKTQYILYKIILPSTFVLSLLFFNSLIFKYISAKYIQSSESVSVILPKDIFSWISCILIFSISAFFEEVLYRFYLIEGFFNLIKKKNILIISITEFLVCFLFSIGHLYLGYLSVINALLAHVILRICYKTTGNIYSGFIAHFCYNIISLILL